MKKKQLNRKLVLNKTTVSDLNHKYMNRLLGGVDGEPKTRGTVAECCTDVNPVWCISGPATFCQSCPVTENDPCECKVGVINPVDLR